MKQSWVLGHNSLFFAHKRTNLTQNSSLDLKIAIVHLSMEVEISYFVVSSTTSTTNNNNRVWRCMIWQIKITWGKQCVLIRYISFRRHQLRQLEGLLYESFRERFGKSHDTVSCSHLQSSTIMNFQWSQAMAIYCKIYWNVAINMNMHQQLNYIDWYNDPHLVLQWNIYLFILALCVPIDVRLLF